MLTGRERSRKNTKENRYIQNKRDVKLPMFKMKFYEIYTQIRKITGLQNAPINVSNWILCMTESCQPLPSQKLSLFLGLSPSVPGRFCKLNGRHVNKRLFRESQTVWKILPLAAKQLEEVLKRIFYIKSPKIDEMQGKIYTIFLGLVLMDVNGRCQRFAWNTLLPPNFT